MERQKKTRATAARAFAFIRSTVPPLNRAYRRVVGFFLLLDVGFFAALDLFEAAALLLALLDLLAETRDALRRFPLMTWRRDERDGRFQSTARSARNFAGITIGPSA